MDLITQILALVNAATPGVVSLSGLLLRKQDGTLSIIAILDETDAQYDDNIKKAQEWLAEHAKA